MAASQRLIVIGGGAAGFFGAIRAKTRMPSLSVVLLEAAPKPLGKVKISGGGRCNVTHACFDAAQLVQYYPRGARELKSVFARFGPQDTMRWFESHGVRLKTEPDGRIFPVSDDSQTIVDCLVQAAKAAGIQIETKAPVQRLVRTETGYRAETPGRVWEAERVLVTTGSSEKAYVWLEALGHTLVPPVPSLFTFTIRDPLLEDLAGISFPRVTGSLRIPGEKPVTQEGPMLITHWGLSGPVILKLSAWGARALHGCGYQAELLLDLVPERSQAELQERLGQQKQATPKKQVGNECPVDLPKRFWQRLVAVEGVTAALPWGEVSQKALNRLSERLKRYPLAIRGKGPFKEEFVTAGGVALKEVDFKTMESRRSPGLYLAGEILDVDALTGGFNLQNAWSTGWLAGEAIARAKPSN